MKKVIAVEEKVKDMDISTEEKIKAAALKLFQKKGYAGTKTRDIAEEAGINIALLNYYFRSKEKLFEIIMEESLHRVFIGIRDVVKKENTTLDEKLEGIVCNYIDALRENPNLPLFVLSEIQANPTGFIDKHKAQKDFIIREFSQAGEFVKQLSDEFGAEFGCENPVQIIINLVSLSVFPFVAKPLLIFLMGMEQDTFLKFMEERKKLIPKWIKSMIYAELIENWTELKS